MEDFKGLAKWNATRDKIKWKDEKGKAKLFPGSSEPRTVHMLCVETEDIYTDMTWEKIRDIAQAQEIVHSQEKLDDKDKDAAVRAATPLTSLADLRNLHHSYF